MKNENMDRKRLALKSSIIGITSQILLLFMNFAIRTMFIRHLNTDILGLDGVIKDCISMLSLADLGVGTAMTYRLYGAVIVGNQDEINECIALYKMVYRTIAIAILLIAIGASFFLKFIIRQVDIDWQFIYFSYYLQVFAIIMSYLLAYKRSILNADQKKYIQTITDTGVTLFIGIIRIGILYFLNSYLLYLAIGILQNILSNVIINYYCNKHYPGIKATKSYNHTLKKDLFNDTKAVFANKILGFVYNSTDNTIISVFMGTSIVGYLVNYKFIFSAIKSLMSSIVSPVESILGNYLNSDKEENQAFQLLKQYTFIRYILSVVFIVPLVCLGQDVVAIYAGARWELDYSVLLLLLVDFYIGCVYGPLGEYVCGMGMFKQQRNVSVVGAVMNLFISLMLVRFMGITGVLLGTSISQLMLWYGNWFILDKYYFMDRQKRKQYWKEQIIYIGILIAVAASAYFVMMLIHINNPILRIFVKGSLVEGGVIFIYWVVFKKTSNYKTVIDIVKKMKKQNK